LSWYFLVYARLLTDRSESSEATTGSGKTRSKKLAKEPSESSSKSKKEAGEEESSSKKKRTSKKSREPSVVGEAEASAGAPPAADKSSSSTPGGFDDSVFSAPSSSAFGIDAMIGDDSESDDDDSGFGRGSSTWGRKFVINQQLASSFADPENDSLNESMRRASMMITVKGATKSPSTIDPSAQASNVAVASDDDFFKDLDMNRRASSRNLIPTADRERKLSQIPPSAQAEYQSALEKLNQGRCGEANTALHAALSQLTELAFKNNVSVTTQWCVYSQLTGLLVEMDRLKNENLFAQRALLSRFVGLVGLRLENPDHSLICLRMAINRNIEMENFRTAAQLLQSMASLNSLTELDKENIPKKQQICASHNYSEAHLPTGAILDAISGQFLLNGYSYALCHKSMQLIRDPTHHFCTYCDATFAERATSDRKCSFCGSNLQAEN
jgi:hypothetical protein